MYKKKTTSNIKNITLFPLQMHYNTNFNISVYKSRFNNKLL